MSAVKEVLTDRRVSQQQIKPLQAFEFIPGIVYLYFLTPKNKLLLIKLKSIIKQGLARNDPIYKEEEEAFKKWWSKTPLGSKRAKAAAEAEGEGDGGKGGKGGKGQFFILLI